MWKNRVPSPEVEGARRHTWVYFLISTGKNKRFSLVLILHVSYHHIGCRL